MLMVSTQYCEPHVQVLIAPVTPKLVLRQYILDLMPLVFLQIEISLEQYGM
jgi:hypothetical protein